MNIEVKSQDLDDIRSSLNELRENLPNPEDGDSYNPIDAGGNYSPDKLKDIGHFVNGDFVFNEGISYGNGEKIKNDIDGKTYYFSKGNAMGKDVIMLNEDIYFSGNGFCFFSDGRIYEGFFENGDFHGVGKIIKDGKMDCEGKFDNGHFVNGTIYYDSGDKYIGEVKNGKKQGKGTYIWASGYKYSGNWEGGERNGDGTYEVFDSQGNVVEKYVGNWENGKKHGKGIREAYKSLNGRKIKTVLNGVWSDNRFFDGNADNFVTKEGSLYNGPFIGGKTFVDIFGEDGLNSDYDTKLAAFKGRKGSLESKGGASSYYVVTESGKIEAIEKTMDGNFIEMYGGDKNIDWGEKRGPIIFRKHEVKSSGVYCLRSWGYDFAFRRDGDKYVFENPSNSGKSFSAEVDEKGALHIANIINYCKDYYNKHINKKPTFVAKDNKLQVDRDNFWVDIAEIFLGNVDVLENVSTHLKCSAEDFAGWINDYMKVNTNEFGDWINNFDKKYDVK